MTSPGRPLSRRQVVAGGVAAAVTLSGCGSSSTTASLSTPSSSTTVPPPADGPNILHIAIDDLRTDLVGFLRDRMDPAGHRYTGPIHTPNLDALCADATAFVDAHCSAPVCANSRASALTGLSPENTGVVGVDSAAQDLQTRSFNERLSAERITSLPARLGAAGYHTGVTGKFFHLPAADQWHESGPWTNLVEQFSPAGFLGGHQSGFDYAVLPDDEVHADQVATDWLVEQITADHDRPWFFGLGLFQPHQPWIVHQEWFDRYPVDEVELFAVDPDDLDDEPPTAVRLAAAPMLGDQTQHEVMTAIGEDAQRLHIQAHLATVSHTDAMIGQVMDTLEASGHLDDTVVIVWSDNGYHLGEKLHWRKQTLWEPATRVPLVIRVPDSQDYVRGVVVDRPVSLLDLVPTTLELAGVEGDETIEGLPLHVDDGREVRSVFGEAVTVRTATERTIVYTPDEIARYDLEADPREQVNLEAPAAG